MCTHGEGTAGQTHALREQLVAHAYACAGEGVLHTDALSRRKNNRTRVHTHTPGERTTGHARRQHPDSGLRPANALTPTRTFRVGGVKRRHARAVREHPPTPHTRRGNSRTHTRRRNTRKPCTPSEGTPAHTPGEGGEHPPNPAHPAREHPHTELVREHLHAHPAREHPQISHTR